LLGEEEVIQPPLSGGNGRRLTDDEVERVKRLVAEGMAPRLAREEVLSSRNGVNGKEGR